MFKALVITVSEVHFRWRISRAISTVVEPESRMMVSPSLISCAAAWPMRRFCAWWRVSLILSGVSSSAGPAGRAPPWERLIAPMRSSA
jgi:hypothetical protein